MKNEFRSIINHCPTKRCDGSGWIKHGWESTPCPDCEKLFTEGIMVDGNPLIELNKSLERILSGEFDKELQELEDKLKEESK